MTTRFFAVALLCVAVPITFAQGTAAPSGIFLIGQGGTLKQIPAVASEDAKATGAGKSMATGGLSKSSSTTRYAGATTKSVVIDRQPAFLFRFIDPSSFSKSERDNREATLAAARASGGGLLPGNDAKDYMLAKLTIDGDSRVAGSKSQTVKFTTQKKGPREFEVRVSSPLEPGEYAFYFGMVGAPTQIFAFTVR